MADTILLAILCCHLPDSPELTTTGNEARPRFRVGIIVVVGNTDTPRSIILNQLAFVAGCWVTSRELQQAESNLVRLGLFRIDLWKGVRPRVMVLEPDVPGEFKDIVVSIEEKPGNRLCYALIDLALLPFTGDVGHCLRLTIENPAKTLDFLRAP